MNHFLILLEGRLVAMLIPFDERSTVDNLGVDREVSLKFPKDTQDKIKGCQRHPIRVRTAVRSYLYEYRDIQ